MAKVKNITLSYPHHLPHEVAEFGWRVEKVSNSTEHNPMDLLKKPAVDALCASEDWNVTLTPSVSR